MSPEQVLALLALLADLRLQITEQQAVIDDQALLLAQLEAGDS
jgi:hypothetical protein